MSRYIFADEYIDESKKSPYVQPERYTKMLGENIAMWLLKRLLDEEADRKIENCSEKPNNCEHITEDGVTCARYPACDDCPDNPLNKVKGPERLVKGKTEPTISKMEQVDKDINVRSKDEPQTVLEAVVDRQTDEDRRKMAESVRKAIKTEPQTERSE